MPVAPDIALNPIPTLMTEDHGAPNQQARPNYFETDIKLQIDITPSDQFNPFDRTRTINNWKWKLAFFIRRTNDIRNHNNFFTKFNPFMRQQRCNSLNAADAGIKTSMNEYFQFKFHFLKCDFRVC